LGWNGLNFPLEGERRARFIVWMTRDALLALSKEDLVALVLAQQAQIEALTAQVAALQARLTVPPKTPDNSSTPPSQGAKPNRPDQPRQRRRGRPGVARALAEHPDHVIAATLAACPHCAHPLGLADQAAIHAYDHGELPPIRPIITRVNRHHGSCPGCRQRVSAPVPAGRARRSAPGCARWSSTCTPPRRSASSG
jgi:transposase